MQVGGRCGLVTTVKVGRLPLLASQRQAIEQLATPVATAAALTAIAGTQGGYFPTSWGWSALAFAWTGALALVIRRYPAVGRLELVFTGAVAAFAGWVALSTIWTRNPSQTVSELQRDIVYPLALVALVLLVRRQDVPRLLGAVLAAITAISTYALAARLFPDRLGGFDSANSISSYRLEVPLGYWNAVGVFAVMGILLAFGFAAHARSTAVRGTSAAAVVVLGSTLYLTFSRGAWLALMVGAVVAVLFDSRRLRLITSSLVVAPAAAAAVLLASQADGLTRSGSTFADATRDGHGLAVWIGLLACLTFLGMYVLAYAEGRIALGPAARRAYGGLLVGVALASLIAVFAAYGSPPTLVRNAYNSFRGPPVGVALGQSFNRRLFTLSNDGRIEGWRVAWKNFEHHRLLGSGAGTFEESWFEHRPAEEGKIRDAHSLYIEVLSELGPIGLALLLFAYVLPFVGAIRARGRSLVPAATAAYIAFVLHSGGDWDWEMPAVTLAGLFLGLALLLSNEDRRPFQLHTPAARLAGVGTLLVLAGFAFLGLLGNVPLSMAQSSFEAARYTHAAREARKAIRWSPWGAGAWQVLGRAQIALHRFPEARTSLANALERAPRDWTIWYDLGNASTGTARVCAYFEAARLNPHDSNIALLRKGGLLPKARPRQCPLGWR